MFIYLLLESTGLQKLTVFGSSFQLKTSNFVNSHFVLVTNLHKIQLRT